MQTSRRHFLQTAVSGLCFSVMAPSIAGNDAARPNIILCMTDDQGWGDTGYNGHAVLQTPHLDQMAQEGLRFDRFYAAAPVCSPTRGSCLTGRHPARYGILGANSGHLKEQEVHLAEVLKAQGYRTGHFGKWHLGTLTTEMVDSNRGRPGAAEHFNPPWQQSFDVCFSTEAKVPTYDPMITPDHWTRLTPGEPFGTRYWTGPGEVAEDNLAGENPRIIMDRALAFIQEAVQQNQPFFAVIWFHTPHSPVVASETRRAMYSDQPIEKQHYYGSITAMDEQLGRLRRSLQSMKAEDNTMLWFCSDNGPAGAGGGTHQQAGKRQQGSPGPFRGRKGSLYEGGIRVPGLLVWPQKIKQPGVIQAACTTSDYYPTILDMLDVSPADQPQPLDGVSLRPLIEGKQWQRPKPMAFEYRKQRALIGNRYKIYSPNQDAPFELYDLIDDPSERIDRAGDKPEIVERMKQNFFAWQASCEASRAGADYP